MTSRHIPLIFVALLTGCFVNTGSEHRRNEPTQTDTLAVERDKSEFLRADINMKAGELRLAGGAAKFLEGTATYSGDALKPIVKYTSAAGRGTLTVDQQSGVNIGRNNVTPRWDLRLPNDVPLDLTVDCGAGEARLNAGSLALRSIEVRIGAGQLELDLRGEPQRSYDVRVRGGVGEAVIRLPKQAAIEATVAGGLGSIDVRGLRREGDRWVSEANENARRTIRVDVKGGIGEIRLIAE
jgi:hypothetical protein